MDASAPMPAASTSHFPFLSQNESKFLRLVHNYLALGQWELAASGMRQLARDPVIRPKVLELLMQIITHGPRSDWIASPTVPTPAHIQWLAVIEYRSLAASDQKRLSQLTKETTEDLEFRLLVDTVFSSNLLAASPSMSGTIPKNMRDLLNDIYQYRARILNLSEPSEGRSASEKRPHNELSEDTLRHIAFVLQQQPLLVSILIDHLSSTVATFAKTTEALQRIYVDAIGEHLVGLRVDDALKLVHFLNVTPEMTEIPLRELFEALVLLSGPAAFRRPKSNRFLPGDPGATIQPALERSRLYEALLRTDSPFLLALFASLENSLQASRADAVLPAAYDLIANDGDILASFWSEFGLHSIGKGFHFIDFVITKGTELAQKGDMEHLARLVRPFPQLRPLVLLASWRSCEEDPVQADRLLAVLWDEAQVSSLSDPDVRIACQRLVHGQRVAKWCIARIAADHEAVGTPAVPDASIVESLRERSALHVLEGRLSRIDENELMELLQSTPIAAGDTEGADAAARDVMLFRSFIAIRAALSLIAPGDGAASAFGNASRRRTMSFHAASTRVALPTSSVLADLDRGVRHIEAHIAGIASASFRVSLLEVLFALLFLKRSDAKAAAAPDDERAELPAFFARTIVFERLVTLLQDALGAVETQGVEARVKRLSGLLSEVQWRYKIISGDSALPHRPDYLAHLISSPKALLTQCLRDGDFARCYEIIDHFNLDEQVRRDVSLCKAIEHLEEQLKVLPASGVVDWKSFPPMDPLDASAVCLDFAMTSTPQFGVAKQFLERAASQLESFTSNTPDSPVASSAERYDKFAQNTNVYKRLRLLADSVAAAESATVTPSFIEGALAEVSFRDIVAGPYPLPADQHALQAYLTNDLRVQQVLSRLQSLCDSLFYPRDDRSAPSAPQLKESLEAALADLEQDNKTHPVALLVAFVRQLLSEMEALSRDADGRVLAEVLKDGPTRALTRLVFEGKGYAAAEQYASRLNIDIVSIIVRACSTKPALAGPAAEPAQPSTPIHAMLGEMLAALALNVIGSSEMDEEDAWMCAPHEAILDAGNATEMKAVVAACEEAVAAAEVPRLPLQERLAFLLNLHNLMMLRAAVTSDLPAVESLDGLNGHRERVSMVVGDLGKVTAHDIAKMAAETARGLEKEKTSIPLAALLQFGLAWCTESVGTVMVFNAENLVADLESLVDRLVLDEVVVLDDSVEVPEALLFALGHSDAPRGDSEVLQLIGSRLSKDLSDRSVSVLPLSWSPLVRLPSALRHLSSICRTGTPPASTPSKASPRLTSYKLTEDVLEYVQAHSPSMGALLCLAHAPGGSLASGTSYVEHALSQTSAAAPSLRRLIELRARAIRDYAVNVIGGGQGADAAASEEPAATLRQTDRNASHVSLASLEAAAAAGSSTSSSPAMAALQLQTSPSTASLFSNEAAGPTWVPDKSYWQYDNDVPTCMLCDAKFSLFNRRHHCRACGKVVCNDCSPFRSVVPGLEGEGPQRVCRVCNGSIASGAGQKPPALPAQQPQQPQQVASAPSVPPSPKKAETKRSKQPPAPAAPAPPPFVWQEHISDIVSILPNVLDVEMTHADSEVIYNRIFQSLLSSNKPAEALKLADRHLSSPPPDSLLVDLADKQPRAASPYLVRIRDKQVLGGLVLQWLPVWPLEVCVDLLFLCRCHPSDDAEQNAEIERTYQRFKLFGEILRLDATWKQWRDLEMACKEDPELVIRDFLARTQRFDLAMDLRVALNLPSSLVREIDSSHLERLLEDGDTIAAFRKVEALGDAAVEICEELFYKNQKYHVKLFVVSYLLNNLPHLLTLETYNRLYSEELGIKLLVRMPKDEHRRCQHVAGYPNLIIETLLMSGNISLADTLMQEFHELRSDNLIVTYARKAIHIRNRAERMKLKRQHTSIDHNIPPLSSSVSNMSASSLPPPSPVTSQPDAPPKLTGDAETDSRLREAFMFADAPNVSLCKRILALCSHPHRIGQACLTFCDQMSQKLSSPDYDGEIDAIVGIIQQLLFHAKMSYLRMSDGNSSLVALCDTYITHMEVLRMLVSERCSASVTLADLNEPAKTRVLRDNLIKDDRFRLALEVASKCRIETEPVWAVWGIQKLHLGQYEEAREKFKNCLVPVDDARGTGANLRLIGDVLLALEEGAPLSVPPVKDMQMRLARFYQTYSKKSSEGIFSAFLPSNASEYADEMEAIRKRNAAQFPTLPAVSDVSSLDKERLSQCEWYLRTYAPPRHLVAFYVKHGLFGLACTTAAENDIGAVAFMEDLLTPCMARGQLARLRIDMRELSDDKVARLNGYLLSACRHFNQAGQMRQLYVLQVFMQDHMRAGLTCIKLFLKRVSEVTDVEDAVGYLIKAKAHLDDAMRLTPSAVNAYPKASGRDDGKDLGSLDSIGAALSEKDAMRYMTTVNLQLETCQVFAREPKAPAASSASAPPAGGEKPPAPPTLFGSSKRKGEICVRLLLLDDFDLAFRIIQEFRLPGVDIYEQAIKAMARAKAVPRVDNLLRNIKGVVSNEDWDRVLDVCVNVFARENQDAKNADKYIAMIMDVTNRISGNIVAGKLKAAYLIAVQYKMHTQVERIRTEAIRQKQQSIVTLCDKYLDEQ